jgi:hypothetical protein
MGVTQTVTLLCPIDNREQGIDATNQYIQFSVQHRRSRHHNETYITNIAGSHSKRAEQDQSATISRNHGCCCSHPAISDR